MPNQSNTWGIQAAVIVQKKSEKCNYKADMANPIESHNFLGVTFPVGNKHLEIKPIHKDILSIQKGNQKQAFSLVWKENAPDRAI